MPWFKVDDSFYDHPKVFDAPDCAVALWTRAGAWSARNLTDGFVPAGLPARLCDDHDTAVRELVRRGLWLRTQGGYRFHDWAEFQPSREKVEADRAAARDRMRRLRSGRSSPDVRANGHRTNGRTSQPRPEVPYGTSGGGARASPATCPRHPGWSVDNCGGCRSEELSPP